MNQFYLSVGSNTDAANNLKAIVRALRKQTEVMAVSSVYESPDSEGGGRVYLNAAVQVADKRPPATLKREVLRPIEEHLGRERNKQAVTADIDIVMVNSDVLSYEGREIPDPDILRHAHIARPLADIAPNLVHPLAEQPLSAIAGQLDVSPLKRRDDITLA